MSEGGEAAEIEALVRWLDGSDSGIERLYGLGPYPRNQEQLRALAAEALNTVRSSGSAAQNHEGQTVPLDEYTNLLGHRNRLWGERDALRAELEAIRSPQGEDHDGDPGFWVCAECGGPLVKGRCVRGCEGGEAVHTTDLVAQAAVWRSMLGRIRIHGASGLWTGEDCAIGAVAALEGGDAGRAFMLEREAVRSPQGEDHEAASGRDRGAEVEPHGRSGRGEPNRAAEPSRTVLPSPTPPRDLSLEGIEAAARAMTDWPDEWDEHDEGDKDVFRQMAHDAVAAYFSRVFPVSGTEPDTASESAGRTA